MSERYVALLRGINVGGNNIIAKDHLRRCFADMGFTQVRTYIQSGNIVFRSAEGWHRGSHPTRRGCALGTLLLRSAGRGAVACRLSRRPRRRVGRLGRGCCLPAQRAVYSSGTTPAEVLASLPPEKQRVTRSAFVKLPAHPVYQQVTIRNHNTVRKLAALLEEI